MASLPSASGRIDESGAGVAVGSEYIAILSCMEKGPIATVRRTSKVQDTRDEFGRGEGLEFSGLYVRGTNLPYLFVRMTSAVAAAIGPVDTTGVTGTSALTWSGTPFDDESLRLLVDVGGTIGTSGIVFRISRDGGRSYAGQVRLGTATSYVIPDTGITVNFAAGTLVAGDLAKCKCLPPLWDAAGLSAAFDGLRAYPTRPRIIIIHGDVDDSTDVQNVIDEMNAMETEDGRHCVAFCSVRDQFPSAAKAKADTVAFSSVSHTITRTTGSFVTEGFKPGMTVTVTGSVSNDGSYTGLTSVTATVLTFAAGLVTEPAVAATVKGSEVKATWRAAIEAVVGATPPAQKVSEKVLLAGGRARKLSPVSKTNKRRPAMWAVAIREMQNDIKVSPAKVSLGMLDGWDLFDSAGSLVEHDERVDGGLLAMRMACLRTFNERAGAYVALPLTLDTDGLPLSRLPIVLVAQLACTVATAGYEFQLNSERALNKDGTIQEGEARRIDGYVQSLIEINLLQPGRASSCPVKMARDVDLRVQGAEVTWEADLTTLGYLEKLAGVVRVGG